MQFCDSCGNLLPTTQNPEVECDCCRRVSKSTYELWLGFVCYTELPSLLDTLLSTVSASVTHDFPSGLRKNWINMPRIIACPRDTWPKTDEECQMCDAKRVKYCALQLRGADEGTTIFYDCSKCGFR